MNNPHFRMPKLWVVVADGARARIYTVERPTGPLQEVETLDNPEGRMHQKDLTTDLPGRSFQRMGEGRSAMDERTDPKVAEVRAFADQLAKRLDEGRVQGEVERLYLVAPPSFLGELRKQLPEGCRDMVAETLAKDLTQLDPQKLRQHLPERLK